MINAVHELVHDDYSRIAGWEQGHGLTSSEEDSPSSVSRPNPGYAPRRLYTEVRSCGTLT